MGYVTEFLEKDSDFSRDQDPELEFTQTHTGQNTDCCTDMFRSGYPLGCPTASQLLQGQVRDELRARGAPNSAVRLESQPTVVQRLLDRFAPSPRMDRGEHTRVWQWKRLSRTFPGEATRTWIAATNSCRINMCPDQRPARF